MPKNTETFSPKWGNNTKLVLSVIVIVVAIFLLVRFSNLVAPLVIALIFAVVLHPVANFLNEKIKISWSWSVTIVYLVTAIILVALITMGGISIIEQIQNLVNFLQKALVDLPDFLAQISTQSFKIGPFAVDLTKINWSDIGNQLIGYVQPILSNIGNFIASLAGGAIQMFGTFLLSLMLSYIIVAETEKKKENVTVINFPGYEYDTTRFQQELNLIWNAFFRGQAIIFFARTLVTIAFLGLFGVHFFVGLGILAGIANLIPYVGALITLITFFFVALFQGVTIFGLDAFSYAIIILVVSWLVENVYDSIVVPKIVGGTLKLSAVVIMVASLIGLNIFGIMGMILAAPILATFLLIYRYIGRKMQDQDPWEEFEHISPAKHNISLFEKIGNRLLRKTKINNGEITKDQERKEIKKEKK
jgi:predicted PurR-regulated permease PerM